MLHIVPKCHRNDQYDMTDIQRVSFCEDCSVILCGRMPCLVPAAFAVFL